MKLSSRIPGWTILTICVILTWLPTNLKIAYGQISSGSERGYKISKSHKYDRLQQEISAHRQKIEQTEEQEFNLNQELKRLDRQLKQGQENLAILQQQLMRQEDSLLEKENEIGLIQVEKDNIGGHVEKRLNAFYQMDDIGVINILFSAATLPELLNLQEYFQAMFHYDQQVINQYRAKISLVAGAQEAIFRQKNQILKTIMQVKEHEKTLIISRQERVALLKRLTSEEALYHQALKAIEKAGARLTETIRNQKTPLISPRKRKVVRLKSDKKRRPVPETGFAALQGHLNPPVIGKLVRLFGPGKDPFGAEIRSQGIDIVTEPNTKVAAVYNGQVIFADSMDGYGQLIIIDHGLQYFSLVSGLQQLLKKQGDKIETGEIIGIAGIPTGLISNGVHFEIRHQTVPLDPMLWLDTEQLQ